MCLMEWNFVRQLSERGALLLIYRDVEIGEHRKVLEECIQ